MGWLMLLNRRLGRRFRLHDRNGLLPLRGLRRLRRLSRFGYGMRRLAADHNYQSKDGCKGSVQGPRNLH